MTARIWKTEKSSDFFAPPDDPNSNLTETIEHCINHLLDEEWTGVSFTYIVPVDAFTEGKWRVDALRVDPNAPDVICACHITTRHEMFLRESKQTCGETLDRSLWRVFDEWIKKRKNKTDAIDTASAALLPLDSVVPMIALSDIRQGDMVMRRPPPHPNARGTDWAKVNWKPKVNWKNWKPTDWEGLQTDMTKAVKGMKKDAEFRKRWSDDPQILEIAEEWLKTVDLNNYDGPDSEDMAFDDYLEGLQQE